MIKPKKALGQNFLQNQKYIDLMIDSLNINANDLIVEIGPGPATLTKPLIQKTKNIIAVEYDKDLYEILLENYKNIKLEHANILEWLPNFDKTNTNSFKILGSLPYYITSPILHKIAFLKNQPLVCVLMVQKEVADKLLLLEPKGSYLSNFFNTFYTIEKLQIVTKGNFLPVPKVDSAIIKLTPKANCNISHNEKPAFEKFLHMGFKNPRKKLSKAFDKKLLQKGEIDYNLRPQNLTLNQWQSLFKLYKNVN